MKGSAAENERRKQLAQMSEPEAHRICAEVMVHESEELRRKWKQYLADYSEIKKSYTADYRGMTTERRIMGRSKWG